MGMWVNLNPPPRVPTNAASLTKLQYLPKHLRSSLFLIQVLLERVVTRPPNRLDQDQDQESHISLHRRPVAQTHLVVLEAVETVMQDPESRVEAGRRALYLSLISEGPVLRLPEMGAGRLLGPQIRQGSLRGRV